MSGRIENRLRDLRDLPELAPPAALEETVLAAMARASSRRDSPSFAKAAIWLVVIGAAALAAALLLEPGPSSDAGRDGEVVAGTLREDTGATSPAATTRGAATTRDDARPGRADNAANDRANAQASDQSSDQSSDPDEYQVLAATSDYLDRVAASLPQRQIMRVSTAGTIVGLEDRIALIDAELAQPGDMQPEYRTALMRDRVEVLNALVNVRYAQSRAFTF